MLEIIDISGFTSLFDFIDFLWGFRVLFEDLSHKLISTLMVIIEEEASLQFIYLLGFQVL